MEWTCHTGYSLGQKVADGLQNVVYLRNDASLKRRLYGSACEPPEPAHGTSRSSNSRSGNLGGDLRPESERAKGLIHDQQPASLGHGLDNRVDIKRGDCSRIYQLDTDPFLASFAGLRACCTISASATTVTSLPHERRPLCRTGFLRSPGTGPLLPSSSRCSRKAQGHPSGRA